MAVYVICGAVNLVAVTVYSVAHTKLVINHRANITVTFSSSYSHHGWVKRYIKGTHKKLVTTVSMHYSVSIAVNLILASYKLTYVEHILAAVAPVRHTILYIPAHILLHPLREVFHSIPAEPVHSSLLFKPLSPLTRIVKHIVRALCRIVNGVWTLAVCSFIETVVRAPPCRAPVTIIAIVSLIRVEILPVLRPATLTAQIIIGATVLIWSLITYISKVFPLVIPCSRVLPTSTAVFTTRVCSVVQNAVTYHLYAISVHHGDHTQEVILCTHTRGISSGTLVCTSFLILVTKVIVVKRGVAYWISTWVLAERRHPYSINTYLLQARSKLRKIVCVCIIKITVVIVPPEGLQNHTFLIIASVRVKNECRQNR